MVTGLLAALGCLSRWSANKARSLAAVIGMMISPGSGPKAAEPAAHQSWYVPGYPLEAMMLLVGHDLGHRSWGEIE
jgi:hypothetical protein